jgi:two-component system, cell cycle response regulator
MTARILVVDDLFVNAKWLCARLRAEHFDVISALSGAEAIAICRQGLCDIVLTDGPMPGMDGFELCRALKADQATAHIPVVLITAPEEPGDRVKGLDCGVDEFLLKPVDEVALIARVRALVRLKAGADELRLRAATAQALGLSDPPGRRGTDSGLGGHILIIEDRASSSERLSAILKPAHDVVVQDDPQEALFAAAAGAFDVVIVSLDVTGYDGLRLCSQFRSLERTRQVGLLMLAESDDTLRVLRGLDIGVNDYLTRPIDRNELLARVQVQIKRKRQSDLLRHAAPHAAQSAATDPLTSLHTRPYLDRHCATLVERAHLLERPLSLLVLDIDRFRTVNEGYGPEAGDAVLSALAARVRRHVRPVDLTARFGGEELMVVMPDTCAESARAVAERIRFAVEGERFAIDGGSRSIPITVSVGIAALEGEADSADALIKRADEALYRAKGAGRNRVVLRSRAA